MSGTPTTIYLFWAGVTILTIFMAGVLFELWRRRIQKHDSNMPLVVQYSIPTLLTALAITGLGLLLGGNRATPPQSQDFAPPTVVREGFAEQVKADQEATKPQTKAELAEERQSEEAKKVSEDREAESDQDKAVNESIQSFRDRMLKSR